MIRLKYMCEHFFLVYKKKQLIFSLIISLILSLPLSIKNVSFFENTGNFFNGILVIEIAYIAIFYSGTTGTEKAKRLIVDHSKKFNYYHYLLVKNYFSVLTKFLVLILIYIINIYNIPNIGFKIFIFNISVYNFIQTLAVCAIITTIDLILSMYFFLWGN